MVHDRITGDFTLEAQKNLLSRHGDPEPVALRDVAAIWGHQSQNAHSKSVKIMDKGGQEHVLTKAGMQSLAQAGDALRKSFIPAKNIEGDEPYMVNPEHVQVKGNVLEDGTAEVSLPNRHTSVYLVDAEFGFGMDVTEAKSTVRNANRIPN